MSQNEKFLWKYAYCHYLKAVFHNNFCYNKNYYGKQLLSNDNMHISTETSHSKTCLSPL